MFHFPHVPYRPLPEAILSELKSAITNKLKFVVCPNLASFPSYYVLSGPETLVTVHDYWYRTPTFVKLLLEILNKRWQTLDVKSMMSELQRSSSQILIIKDTLSSVYRFKLKEGAILS